VTEQQGYDRRCEEYYWLVSECNIDPREVGELTRIEIEQLKHGAEKHNEKQERKMNSNSGADPTRASKVKREEEALAKVANG